MSAIFWSKREMTKITNIAENQQKFVQALPVLSGLTILKLKKK